MPGSPRKLARARKFRSPPSPRTRRSPRGPRSPRTRRSPRGPRSPRARSRPPSTPESTGIGGKPGRFGVSARDFCRFGLLYRREGRWRGRRIVRRDLALRAVSDLLPLTIPRTEAKEAECCPEARSIGGGGNQCDHSGGYSWLWWLNRRSRDGRLWFPDVPGDFHACFGHGGREGMAILPREEIVASWIGNRVHQNRERGNRAFLALVEAAEGR